VSDFFFPFRKPEALPTVTVPTTAKLPAASLSKPASATPAPSANQPAAVQQALRTLGDIQSAVQLGWQFAEASAKAAFDELNNALAARQQIVFKEMQAAYLEELNALQRRAVCDDIAFFFGYFQWPILLCFCLCLKIIVLKAFITNTAQSLQSGKDLKIDPAPLLKTLEDSATSLQVGYALLFFVCVCVFSFFFRPLFCFLLY
jgi:hypothetical protein